MPGMHWLTFLRLPAMNINADIKINTHLTDKPEHAGSGITPS